MLYLFIAFIFVVAYQLIYFPVLICLKLISFFKAYNVFSNVK